uniref:ZP domain-containing protein n=1 Tax=Pygocentrus nattereri TaxID=42514 RepID=A0AAR2IJ64_PYGNA
MLSLHGLCCTSWLVIAAAVVSAQKTFNQRPGLKTECLGNVMRLTADKLLASGSQLEIEAVNGSKVVPLTPALAAKCGYSVESDPWGNAKFSASLLSCFIQNQGDHVFDIRLRLRLFGNKVSEEDVTEVTHSCEFKQWASREILCERNFMEISVNRLPPEISLLEQMQDTNGDSLTQVPTSIHNIWKMVFYTPKEKPMMLRDVEKAGYGVKTTPTRLVVRSPYNMADTYTQNVDGVQMEVLSVTTYFKRGWSVTLIDTTAACPTGGLLFTDNIITWYMPRYIPTVMDQEHRILELYMGINGKRLDPAHMNAMGYTLSLTDSHIIISLPVGGPDGYYKVSYEYHTTYSIEPMLELLWKEGMSDVTRYKVHYPITTPPKPQPPQITDNTVAELGFFNMLLGTFLHDVELINITSSTGVMTLAEANVRGFNVQQHGFSNGSKAFTIQVPFSDPVVLKATTTYTLPLIFGLVILPEYTPFSHPALLEITVQDVTPPTVRGNCDDENFYVTVTYGNQGKNFNVMVGGKDLFTDLYAEYSVHENATHLSMTVPFLANEVTFELAHQSSIRARLHALLWDPVNNWHLKNFSLACSFPLTMTECFSNGTMTALAVKVESASRMNPSQLTLNDPSCKPTFSNGRFAYFYFDASSCGTTRTFYDDVMMYQNEISVGGRNSIALKDAVQPDYHMVVSCYYMLNDTQMVTFFTNPRRHEPFAESGVGKLHVRMRLAKDSSYNTFYMEDDYPVVKYLTAPLYFEVDLIQSTDPRLELVLENCWATVDGDSTMSWDLIVNGCENPDDSHRTTFQPVAFGELIQYPLHTKRFEVKMFTFVKDDMVLRDQIFVNCEAVICDIKQPDAICRGQCLSQNVGTNTKGMSQMLSSHF